VVEGYERSGTVGENFAVGRGWCVERKGRGCDEGEDLVGVEFENRVGGLH